MTSIVPLKNKQRDVWLSNIAFIILQQILQSHPFLISRKLKRSAAVLPMVWTQTD